MSDNEFPSHTLLDLTLADIMSTAVRSIAPDCSLHDAAANMASAHVSCLVVQQDRRPVGILTERDMVLLLQRHAPDEGPVSAYMSAPVLSAYSGLDFRSAYGLLRQHGIRHLIAVDERGETAGVATESDFRVHLGLEVFHHASDLRGLMDIDIPILSPDDLLSKALEKMIMRGHDYILVGRNRLPAGILTERDIPRLLATGADTDDLPLHRVMSYPVHAVPICATVSETMAAMALKGFRHVAVVDDQGCIAGMVSQHRLLERLASAVIEEAWAQRDLLEDARREFDSRLGMVLESTGLAVWEYHFVPDRFNWSATMAVLLDCHPDDLPVTAADFQAVLHPEDRPVAIQAARKAFRQGEIVEGEWRLSVRDGQVRWVRFRSRVSQRAPDGRPLVAVGVISDVTEHKRIKDQLRDREEMFGVIFNQARDGIALIDVDSLAFAEFNDAACSALGYTREEFARLHLWDVVADVSREDLLQRIDEIVIARGKNFEEIHRDRDGIPRNTRVSSRVVAIRGTAYLTVIWSDITSERAAAAALKESEGRFRSLFDSIDSIAVQAYDEERRVIMWNAASSRLYGYTAAEALGRPMEELIIPAAQASDFVSLHRKWLTGGRAMAGGEVTLRHKDGNSVPVFTSRVLQRNLSGRCELFCVDVDLRPLQEVQFQFRSLADSGSALVWTSDGELRFNYCNSPALEFTGESGERLFGRGWLKLVHPDDREHYVLAVEAASARREPFSANYRLRRHDGEYRWMLENGRPRLDSRGTFIGYIGHCLDITEAKQTSMELEKHRLHLEDLVKERTTELEAANHRLQASDKRLQALFAISQRAISMGEEDLFCAGVNAAIELIGASEGFIQIIDQDGTALAAYHHEGGHCQRCAQATSQAVCARFIPALAQARKERTPITSVMKASPSPGDTACGLPHSNSLAVPIAEGDRVFAVLGIAGRAKPYEPSEALELQLIADDLWRIVMRRRAEFALEEARNVAERASRAKSSFLANMSHEIRTPMNAIIGLTHLLRREATDPKQQEQLRKVHEAAQHLLAIINGILDISKIEAGKMQLEHADFRIEAIFDRIAAMLADRLAEKGLQLRREIDPRLAGQVRGDALRIGQILINFATNAVKFTEQGSITLRAFPEETVDDTLITRIEVVDTGIGILPEIQERLFNDFEQADTSTTRKYGGTGLGLAISKRLADLMGGSVGVSSKPHGGSTFWLTLPLTPGSGSTPTEVGGPVEHADAELKLTSAYRGTRVLVAEDNATNREVILELLGHLGMIVDTAENGAFAMEQAGSNIYDLILMDVQMPVLDGIEATRAIRRLPGYRDVPILAVTANAFDEDRERCFAAGMNDHIPKPIEPNVLFNSLLRWLPRRDNATEDSIRIAQKASTPAAKDDAALDRLREVPGLDTDAGVRRLLGKRASYLRLLGVFVKDHGDDVARLRAALASQDAEDAQRIAHSLKGASGMLGATKLQDAAAKVEQAIMNGAGQGGILEKKLSDLENLLQTFSADVAAALGGQSRKQDWQALRESYSRLCALLAEGDIGAIENFRENEAQLAMLLGPSRERVERLVANYDFETALNLLRKCATGHPELAAES